MANEQEITPPPEAPLPDVVVALEPETTPGSPAVETVKDPAVKDLVDQYKALEARSEEIEKAKNEATERAAQAQREADAARREAESAKAQATSSNLDTITTALASAQAELEAADREYKSARQNGDIDAETAALARGRKAEMLISRYDEAKADLEARQKTGKPEYVSPSDPVEAYVRGRAPKTADWLRGHRDFVIDPRKNAKLTAAHYDAVAEGITPDTDAYFEHVERLVGLRKETTPVTEGDNVARPGAAPAKKPAQQRAVAPVGSSSANGGQPSSNTVTLTAGEARAAVDGTHVWNYDDPTGQKRFKRGDAIGIQEFARRKQKMTEQGAYDRTYETQ